jgi:hypothetical protein
MIIIATFIKPSFGHHGELHPVRASFADLMDVSPYGTEEVTRERMPST